MNNEKLVKNSNIFVCNICKYSTDKKFNYNIHLLTRKHINNNKNNEIIENPTKKYLCKKCEKGFNDRAGLWRHNKKCNGNGNCNGEDKDKQIEKLSGLVTNLMKQNNDLVEIVNNLMK